MNKPSILKAILVLIFLLAPTGIVRAHGQPVISVQPVVASAGSQITVTGSAMAPGENFAVSLEGVSGSIPLGNATATGQGEEGGFETQFAIPENTSPGSYIIHAVTDDGAEADADLTVTLPTTQASASPATMQEPSGELHQLDRSKPLGEIIGAGVLALLSGIVGLWLVLARKK